MKKPSMASTNTPPTDPPTAPPIVLALGDVVGALADAEGLARPVEAVSVVVVVVETDEEAKPVEVTLWVVEAAILAGVDDELPAVRAAEYSEQRTEPTDSAEASCAGSQDSARQNAAEAPMEALEGPHWHASSVGAQPTAVKAEERQPVWR